MSRRLNTKKIICFNALIICIVTLLPQAKAAPPLISDDIWRSISNSEAYRSFPKARATAVSYQAHSVTTGKDIKGGIEYDQTTSIISTPEEKCLKTQLKSINSPATPDNHVCLHSIQTSFGDFRTLTKVEIEGSLFPLKIGAAMRIQSEMKTEMEFKFNNTKRTDISVSSSLCKVISRGQAHDLQTRLTGVAWKVSCDIETHTSGGRVSSRMTDYYLEDAGIFISQIGVIDCIVGEGSYDWEYRFVLPSAGFTSQFWNPLGIEHGLTTTTYANYEWQVTK